MKKLLKSLLAAMILSGCAAVRYDTAADGVLRKMNAAYANRDIDAFMQNISPDFMGNVNDLKLAVENDFVGFVSVDFNTYVAETEFDKESRIVRAKVLFLRSAKSARLGTDNQSGETTLEFDVDEKGDLKLRDMPYPALYGLITP